MREAQFPVGRRKHPGFASDREFISSRASSNPEKQKAKRNAWPFYNVR
jgi:hypothetical protein